VGKLEKLIVLTVLFLVAVILGVSLNSDRGVAEASSGPVSATRPTDALSEALAKAGQKSPAAAEQVRRPAEPDPRTLSTTTKRRAAQPARPPQSAEAEPETAPPAILETEPAAESAVPDAPAAGVRTLEGLVPTALEGLMVYTWRAGDSYASVAETYLGPGQVRALKQANEGRAAASLQVGDKILVPVPSAESTPPPSVYVVQPGDVLGSISLSVYGTSKKWRQIFDANRDVLSDANSLKVGQRLRIPAQ